MEQSPFEQSKHRLNFFLMYSITKSIRHSRYTLIYRLSLRVAARIKWELMDNGTLTKLSFCSNSMMVIK